MPTNDFLAFATGGGANVMSQSDWAALAARLSGFTAGVANSAQVNKAIRQAVFGVAALAQFMADQTGSNVNDDGVIANFKATLLSAVQRAGANGGGYGAAGGSANALTLTLSPAPLAYAAGQTFVVLASHTNTAAATINVNGLGVKSITNPSVGPLNAGDIAAGEILILIYDGTEFQFVNAPSTFSVAAAVQDQNWVYAGSSGGTANALTATLTPASAALVAGMALELKITTANTSGATLNLDGHGAKTIVTGDGSVLVGGEMSVGMIARLRYDGTNFQLGDLSPRFIAGTLVSGTKAVNPTAGRYYAPSHVDPSGSPTSVATVTMHLVPFARGLTIDALAFGEGTSSTTGSSVRLGIYDSDANGLPNNLIDQSGIVALTGSISTKVGALGASHSINGLTWLAILVNVGTNNPSFAAWQGNAEAKAIFGSSSIDMTSLSCGFTTTSVSWAALPATAPGGLTLSNSIVDLCVRAA